MRGYKRGLPILSWPDSAIDTRLVTLLVHFDWVVFLVFPLVDKGHNFRLDELAHFCTELAVGLSGVNCVVERVCCCRKNAAAAAVVLLVAFVGLLLFWF